MSSTCPFCDRIARGDLLLTSPLAAAFADGYPISPGHTLVVPRRHEADFFALSHDEQAAVWRLAAAVRAHLDAARPADGYNVGLNAGAAAGQTVLHAHVHVVPRFAGDVQDPRGGVRWVVPDKARYWSEP